jgi:hypothetical protein
MIPVNPSAPVRIQTPPRTGSLRQELDIGVELTMFLPSIRRHAERLLGAWTWLVRRTDAGLWIPAGSEVHLMPTWKSWLTSHIPIVISFLSLLISATSLWVAFTSTRTSQRAYLSHTLEVTNGTDLAGLDQSTQGYIHLEYRLNIKNLGNTPARRISFAIEPLENNPMAGKEVFKMESMPVWLDLGPKDSYPVDGSIIFESKRGMSAFFVTALTGAIRYDDIFGAHHELSVCYTVTVTKGRAVARSCYYNEPR